MESLLSSIESLFNKMLMMLCFLFCCSLVKDSEEHYFAFRDRVGKTARPAMLKFMDQVVDATEPHIKKARLLVQREAGFQSARWALKDSNQLWLSWLDCLLDILGDPAPAASESGDEWDTGLPELAERLRRACMRGKRTRLDTTAEDEKATRGGCRSLHNSGNAGAGSDQADLDGAEEAPGTAPSSHGHHIGETSRS